MSPYLVGPGWWTIIDDYLEQAKRIDPNCELEVKEKYGSLRADILTENDDTRAALYQIEREMEKATAGVCEICGAPGKIVNRRSWQTTVCTRCAALDDAALRPIYKETEERHRRERPL